MHRQNHRQGQLLHAFQQLLNLDAIVTNRPASDYLLRGQTINYHPGFKDIKYPSTKVTMVVTHWLSSLTSQPPRQSKMQKFALFSLNQITSI